MRIPLNKQYKKISFKKKNFFFNNIFQTEHYIKIIIPYNKIMHSVSGVYNNEKTGGCTSLARMYCAVFVKNCRKTVNMSRIHRSPQLTRRWQEDKKCKKTRRNQTADFTYNQQIRKITWVKCWEGKNAVKDRITEEEINQKKTRETETRREKKTET